LTYIQEQTNKQGFIIPEGIVQGILEDIVSTILTQLTPAQKIKVSEWAKKYRYLSPEDTDNFGLWSNVGFEYLDEPMDCLLDPYIRKISIMKSAQTGFTQAMLNMIAYLIDMDPGPMLICYPTESNAIKFSKRKLEPMLRDTERLHGKVSDPKTKDGSNATLEKTIPGGFLSIVGLASPNTLTSQSIKYLFIDEKDRIKWVTGEEGDTINIVEKRLTGFNESYKNINISTPTTKGRSRIESDYENSDQRKRQVPCPRCNHFQVLDFWNLKGWRIDKGVYIPEETYYECEACKAHLDERDKYKMLPDGLWIKDKPEIIHHAGFYISELYSTLRTWEDLVRSWISKKNKPTERQTFFNLELGLPYEDVESKPPNELELMNRCEEYTSKKLPEGVLALVGSADIQGDRIEVKIKGFGMEEESWLIDYQIFYGNPMTLYNTSTENIWRRVELFLETKYLHESDVYLRLSAFGIDTGYATKYAQTFVKKMQRKGNKFIFALQGDNKGGKQGITGAPLLSRPSQKNKLGVRQFMIGTDTAKKTIFNRLNIVEFGPGYMHFPKGTTEEYFKQLALSEKLVNVYQKGVVVRKNWVKQRARNEALDLEGYCLSALEYANIKNWDILKQMLQNTAEEKKKNAVNQDEEGPKENNSGENEPKKILPKRIKIRTGKNFVNDY
jgi:phage terminase large subunit GpA-like protein